ncbi:MAG: hypothetical protein ACP5KW_11085 [Thermoproteota archaeon]
MDELMFNSLALKEYPQEFKTLDVSIHYTQLNQILGPSRDVCYYLYGGRLYFLGDEAIVSTVLRGHGFRISNVSSTNLDLINDWEVIRPIFYKSLRFYFMRHNFVWRPRRRNQVFVLEPEEFEGTRLVHEVYNDYGERLLVFEGFRYWLEFLEGELVLTLLPKVKPILPLKSRLTREDIIFGKDSFQEVGPFLMRRKGFSRYFRGIALKPNRMKRNILRTIIKLLSEGKEELVIPAGNLQRGLVFDTEFIGTEEVEADFYGE